MLTNIETKYMKKNIPDFNVGDTIRVSQKIKEGNKERVQIFEGVVIAKKHGNGPSGSFTVRKISVGVGVEKCFPVHLPTIIKIERIKTAQVRQSKLYYLRDLRGRASRLKGEKRDSKVWEEADAEKEIEAIKEEQAEEAEIKAKEEAEELAKEEAKVEQALKAHQEDDQTTQESGVDGGESRPESDKK